MQRHSEQILTEWLVLSAQSGKADAIEQLLILWHPRFLHYATQQSHDAEAAKDVVQDTLIVIARKIRRLKDPIAFPKWAYQILHRRGVDYIRKEVRRKDREAEMARSDVQDDEQSTQTGNESRQSVHAAINQLDGLTQNVIQLFYLHDLSQAEIARICDIPIGTVKSRLHTAREKLKTLLGDTP